MSKTPQPPSKEFIATLPVFPGLELHQVSLLRTPAEAEAAMAVLRTQSCLGFDTESKPTFRKGEESTGPHIAQFSTLQHGYVFQLRHPDVQAAVAELLHAEHIAKVGFGLGNDRSQLAQKFAIHPHNLVDLDRNFRQLGYRNSIGAKTAIAIYFQQRFIKSKSLSTSNWSLPDLNDRQVLYAANDAYAALRVFVAMPTVAPKADTPDSEPRDEHEHE